MFYCIVFTMDEQSKNPNIGVGWQKREVFGRNKSFKGPFTYHTTHGGGSLLIFVTKCDKGWTGSF